MLAVALSFTLRTPSQRYHTMATTDEQPITEQQPEATAEQEAAAGTSASAEGGSSPSDMVAWFESAITNYEATFIVFYRGYW